VLSAGALGGYFGARLTQGGSLVEYLVRPRRAAQLATDGVVIVEGDSRTSKPAKGIRPDQISGAYDAVLLACKAYDLDEALDAIGGERRSRTGYITCVLERHDGEWKGRMHATFLSAQRAATRAHCRSSQNQKLAAPETILGVHALRPGEMMLFTGPL
jgi:hypothetical protein